MARLEIYELRKMVILEIDRVTLLERKRFFKVASLILAFLFLFVSSPWIGAQSLSSIPRTATILEERTLAKNRKLVLWMASPQKHPSEIGEDDLYTCPDHTRGSYYSGLASVSLMNTSTSRIINTLKVMGLDIDGPNPEIDLPYLIRAGYSYKVPNGSPKIERKPQILALKDYNGDGIAHEFALFDAQACMGLGTSLIGYSQRQDRVIQYPIETSAPEGNSTVYWLDYLFSKKPISPGRWRYEIDYRGRGGTLDKFDVRYNKRKETFVATIRRER